jgi:hypothetical protein
MLRAINVPTDVFAAIWARRQNGEDDEGAILRRILGCRPIMAADETEPFPGNAGGVYDGRNGVHFPRGFVAFRTYKHKHYEAVAQDGAWLRKDNGERYATLNQVNASIAAGAENIWNGNWKYRSEDGTVRSIDSLRR